MNTKLRKLGPEVGPEEIVHLVRCAPPSEEEFLKMVWGKGDSWLSEWFEKEGGRKVLAELTDGLVNNDINRINEAWHKLVSKIIELSIDMCFNYIFWYCIRKALIDGKEGFLEHISKATYYRYLKRLEWVEKTNLFKCFKPLLETIYNFGKIK